MEPAEALRALHRGRPLVLPNVWDAASARAFAAAGADCTYPIGWLDEATTARLTEAIPGPVNVLSWADGPSVARLGELGVARVTFGSGLFKEAMATVAARAADLAT